MAYDNQLWLTGTASSPVETIASTNNTRAGTLVPPNRVYIAELRIGGSVDGTSPTLDLSIRAHSTSAGTGHNLAVFTQMTQSTTTLAPESATGATRMAVRTRAFRVDEAAPYIKIAHTVSGTAVFPSCSVMLIPVDNVNN